MDRISELREILGGFLPWHKSRLDCFTRMLLALFAVRTVNLKELAIAFTGKAQKDSRYKRLKRFFALFKINQTLMAQFIFKLFFKENNKLYLTIDRTNWFWGKSKINVLTLAIAYEGLAIPLFWQFLNKAGNASAKEHIAIVQRFVKTFSKSHIVGVLGDREFASAKLFRWCNKQNIPFYIRIKDGSQVYIGKKKWLSAKKIFKGLNCKESTIFAMSIELYGQRVYLAGSRSDRGELMVVATNRDPRTAIAIYLRRWEIESLFQGLKNRGFRFEETRITQLDRLDKLMSLLAIGFSWAHKVGEWYAIKKPIILNRYKESRRPQYSYFRYGFDLIREAVLHGTAQKKELKNYIKQLIFPDFTWQESLL